MRKTITGLLAGISMFAYGTTADAQELTIFWAEWDPANYLQELANLYEAETGVKGIAVACDKLAKGKRRACCFDRSGMYSNSLCAPEPVE